jgi:3-deoxy-manno-octulosonate cytidylyltransferase (CMP-KDO synthetase)
MKVCTVIPARYASSRFPGKPLVPILGRAMILRVCDQLAAALGRNEVRVATDDERIARVVRDAGYAPTMTSSEALTGTDRVAEVARKVEAELYLNVQGDEPMLDPADILAVLRAKERAPDAVTNGMCRLDPAEDPSNTNLPKVAVGADGRLIYMSRLPVPGSKRGLRRPTDYWKQVCIYAFTRAELELFASLGGRGRVEEVEDIEILRFLELGHPVRMVETSGASLAVDVPEDVPKVEAALRLKGPRP